MADTDKRETVKDLKDLGEATDVKATEDAKTE